MTITKPPATRPFGLRDIFSIFIRAGFAFGGGMSIIATMQDELVRKRKLMSGQEFLSYYALSRILPTGSMNGLAVAFGYRFGGIVGTAIALLAIVLPAFVLTIGLTVVLGSLHNSPLLALLPGSVLPAAVALVVVAALRIGRPVYRRSLEPLVAAGTFFAMFFFNFNPALLMLLGGVVGMLTFKKSAEAEEQQQEVTG